MLSSIHASPFSSIHHSPRRISRRAVHFGGVLAAEGPAPVRAPAAVGVDDDLAASEACVAMGPANHEPARRVHVVNGLVVQVL